MQRQTENILGDTERENGQSGYLLGFLPYTCRVASSQRFRCSGVMAIRTGGAFFGFWRLKSSHRWRLATCP